MKRSKSKDRQYNGQKKKRTKGKTMIYKILHRKQKIELPLSRNHDRNHKLWNIVSTYRDIYIICRCCWRDATYKWNFHNEKIEIIPL